MTGSVLPTISAPRRLPAVLGIVTALLLFLIQQVYCGVKDARADAAGDAAALLEIARLARLQGRPEAQPLLLEVARRFDHITAARYCDEYGCLVLGSDAPQAGCEREASAWWLCVESRSPQNPEASIAVRYSLAQAHDGTLRNLLFFVAILAIASAIWSLATRRLRRQVSQAEVSLHHAATRDAMTGLLNRSAFENVVDGHMSQELHGPSSGAFLCVNLDRFKEVNDNHGHHCGDAVLREAARRLERGLTGTDLLCRLGGDEFGLLMSADKDAVDRRSSELMKAMAEPMIVDGHAIGMEVSIGTALLDGSVRCFDEALRRADVALHEAKREGRGCLAHFSETLDLAARERYQLQGEMKTGLARGQFYLDYQPQVDQHGYLRGVEALVRWRHPTRGMVRPDQFIAIAEESGLIIELGLTVAEQACADLVQCRIAGLGLPCMSINVSTHQLANPGLIESLQAILSRHGLMPCDLELEITESSLMAAGGHEEQAIRDLARLGFRIAIDDFGTGYSSLSRLQAMPVDKLKIDRSFVMSLPGTDNASAIVEAILSMANRLGLKIVAEGVETATQAGWLIAAGCGLMQGYYYARPMSLERLLSWVAHPKGSQPKNPSAERAEVLSALP